MSGALEGCPAANNCWEWAATYFGDCVCGDRDEASFILGLASIVAWGTAELPQIWSNFRTGSSEGISFAFIVTWLTGDCFNLVGRAARRAGSRENFPVKLYHPEFQASGPPPHSVIRLM